jgi:hypothetical protein
VGGGGATELRTVRGCVLACSTVRSSRGRAVAVTKPESAEPKARPFSTASSADGATSWVIVTGVPVEGAAAGPPMSSGPQPARATATLTTPPHLMIFLTSVLLRQVLRPSRGTSALAAKRTDEREADTFPAAVR